MSLLRTAARASIATRVIGNTHRRQQKRWAAEDAAAAQPSAAPVAPAVVPAAPAAPVATPAAAGPADPAVMIAQLQQLAQLRDAGVLTDAEFETQKQRILTGA
ncbi:MULTISPECIES: SHOCT domain-containing protein [unclassified Leucobacter]|uniref:SHOCT domain-containing protein n=1 Tax=unclassified Leucobacter TaxID=2621730 RepID=UPI00165D8244|nr:MULTISPECIES: SHOCT domain-containing protein [unclassified Leucobacter]MBC9935827.1 SHOCT domain-containing protein [Leucobacter sp. cx-87]